MVLKPNINDREFDKFVEDPAGDTAVRTLIANDSSSPVVISGSFGSAAPTGPLRTSQATVTDTSANPIPTALTNRVALVVRNTDSVESVFLGESSGVGVAGWEIGPNEDFSIDLDSTNVFYLIANIGKSVVVKFLEIASSASSGGGGGLSITRKKELLTGTINGVNSSFTTSIAPYGDDYFDLFLNGRILDIGTDYTRSGVNVTLVVPPNFGQTLSAVYWY